MLEQINIRANKKPITFFHKKVMGFPKHNSKAFLLF